MGSLLALFVVIITTVLYHLIAKAKPEGLNIWVALIVTYLVALAASVGVYLTYFFKGDVGGLKEFSKLNWAPFALGGLVLGLEGGWLWAYSPSGKWDPSLAQPIVNTIAAIALIFVGWLFKESFSWYKFCGVLICSIGMIVMNLEEIIKLWKK